MATVVEKEFYRLTPRFGKAINLQWEEFRTNSRNLHPLAKNEQLDVTDSSQLDALAGLAFGEQSFRNKFRVFYDEAADAFKIQVNQGTVASPTWTDYVIIDENIGKVTIIGGLDSSQGGFYGIVHPQQLERVAEAGAGQGTTIQNPSQLFFNVETGFYLSSIKGGSFRGAPLVNFSFPFGRAQVFRQDSGSFEWQINHNFNFTPVVTEIYDGRDCLIQESEINKIDVSDPNVAYFYFTSAKSGRAVISTGGLGAVELRPADPFYLVVRTGDQQPVQLAPNAKVVFKTGEFYVNLDTNKREAHVSLQPRIIRKADIIDFKNDPFYLNDAQDVSAASPSNNQILKFNASTGKWEPANDVTGQFYLNDLQDVNVPAPSDADFLSFNAASGKWVPTGGSGTVNFRDGVNSITSGELNFNGDDFYLSTDLGGAPVANLKNPTVRFTDGSNINDARKLNFNNDHFYLSADLSGDPVANVKNPPRVVQTNGLRDIENFRQLKFNRSDFYLTEDSEGNPIVNSSGTGGGGGGANELNDLTDVTITSVSDEEVLAFDTGTSQWVNVDRLRMGNGLTSAPSYSFLNATNTGVFLRAGADVGFVRGGSLIAYVTSTGVNMNSSSGIWASGIHRPGLGSATTPVFSFDSDTNTGMFGFGSDRLGFAAGGSAQAEISEMGLEILRGGRVKSPGFYLVANADGAPGSDLSVDWISFHIESPSVKNYFLDSGAAQGYIVDSVRLITSSGAVQVGFYIRADGEGGNGVGIAGLDPINVGASAKEFYLSTGSRVVNIGDELIMSAFANFSGADLRGTIKIRRN